MPMRGQHFTDSPTVGGVARRTLRNWSNYQRPGRPWASCAPGVSPATGTPPDWSGAFDFSHGSQNAALQCFFRDATDPGNRAMVGARLASDPGAWINIKAMDCTAADVVFEEGGALARWPDLWANSDLTYRPGAGKLRKEIICKAPGHPTVFRSTIKTPPGYTPDLSGGRGRLLDTEGVERLGLSAPYAYDSSTVYPTHDGKKPIGVELRDGGTFGAFRVVELVLDQDDLDGAVYPVTVDPTVPITGTTDVEDVHMIPPPSGTNNYGSAVVLQATTARPLLTRIATIGSIPAGTITGLRFLFTELAASDYTLNAFFIADANDWVEGTASGSPQAGSVCWDQAKFGSQNWAGSAGCGTSGTDYDADASPPAMTSTGSAGLQTFSLDPTWAPLWRDGARAPNGIKIVNPAGPDSCVAWSTEFGSDQPYFEVDWAPAGGQGRRFFFMGG